MNKQNNFYYLIALLTGLLLCSAHQLTAQSQVIETEKTAFVEVNHSRFHISMNGGLGYLIGSTKTAKEQMNAIGITEKNADRYYDDFKLGQQAGLSIHYMISPSTGIGVDYNIFTTGSQLMALLYSNDNSTYFYGKFSEKVYTNYLGLSFKQYQRLTGNLNIYEKLSAGMAFYRNESHAVVAPALLTGNAYASTGEVGISYQFYKHLSINLGGSYFISSLKKVKMTDGIQSEKMELKGDSKENLSRLNLSAGVEFNF